MKANDISAILELFPDFFDLPQNLKIKQVAEFLDISESSLYHDRLQPPEKQKFKIKNFKAGESVRYVRDDLARYILLSLQG